MLANVCIARETEMVLDSGKHQMAATFYYFRLCSCFVYHITFIYTTAFIHTHTYTVYIYIYKRLKGRLYGHNTMKCHNCSCGRTAVYKLALYRTRIKTISNEGLWSTSWRSGWFIPPHTESTHVSKIQFLYPPDDALMVWRFNTLRHLAVTCVSKTNAWGRI